MESTDACGRLRTRTSFVLRRRRSRLNVALNPWYIALRAPQCGVGDVNADSQVRAAHSLMSITHSLKLLLLLSDEAQIAAQRDRALMHASEEAAKAKTEAAEILDQLLGHSENNQ